MSPIPYKYTKLKSLSSVLGGDKIVFVYGIVKHFAVVFKGTCNPNYIDYMLTLVDETEATPVLCELRFKATDKMKGFFGEGTIVRIHRCRCRKQPNGIYVLHGTVNVAGMHLVAFSLESFEGYEPCFKSSENFTFTDSDKQNIDRLYAYWEKNKWASVSRQQFHSELNQITTRAGPSHSATDENEDPKVSANQNIQQDVHMTQNLYQNTANSIAIRDIAAQNADSAEFALDEEIIIKPEVKQQNVFEEDYCSRLRNKISTLQCTDFLRFSEVEINKYFNIVCQVIEVYIPKTDSITTPPYLKVCDGTQVTIACSPCIHSTSDEFYSVKRGPFNEQFDTSKYADRVYAISSFGLYAEQVKKCNPGDYVKITNIKAYLRGNDRYIFTLDANKGEKYNRGIRVLEKFGMVDPEPPSSKKLRFSSPKNHESGKQNANDQRSSDVQDEVVEIE